MARNGAGTFNLPAGQPVVTGTTISSTVFNTLTTDLANALTTSIASDGQTTPTANLKMGGFKLTGLGAATVAGDAARYEQVGALALAQGAAASGANSDITSLSTLASINAGPLLGSRMKNGNKLIAQRATSATVTAGTAVPTASTGYPTVDRFYGYCTGANVTVAQIAGSDATNKRVQYTGAASVTAIGHGTRMEASETAHMAGQTCTYSVELANSLLTTVTWTAYFATSTDAFGTVGTPTKTQISTGSFTVTSTVTKYSTQIAVPAGATTGIEVVLTVGAQVSGTWTIGREDFRLGSVSPTYFEVPDYDDTLRKCYRYAWVLSGVSGQAIGTGQAISTSSALIPVRMPATMRSAPTLGALTVGNFALNNNVGTGTACNGIALSGADPTLAYITAGLGSGPLTAGNASIFAFNGTQTLPFYAEIP